MAETISPANHPQASLQCLGCSRQQQQAPTHAPARLLALRAYHHQHQGRLQRRPHRRRLCSRPTCCRTLRPSSQRSSLPRSLWHRHLQVSGAAQTVSDRQRPSLAPLLLPAALCLPARAAQAAAAVLGVAACSHFLPSTVHQSGPPPMRLQHSCSTQHAAWDPLRSTITPCSTQQQSQQQQQEAVVVAWAGPCSRHPACPTTAWGPKAQHLGSSSPSLPEPTQQ